MVLFSPANKSRFLDAVRIFGASGNVSNYYLFTTKLNLIMCIKSFICKLFGVTQEQEIANLNLSVNEVKKEFEKEKYKENLLGWENRAYFTDDFGKIWYYNASSKSYTDVFAEAEIYPNAYEAYKHYGYRQNPFNKNKIVKIYIASR